MPICAAQYTSSLSSSDCPELAPFLRVYAAMFGEALNKSQFIERHDFSCAVSCMRRCWQANPAPESSSCSGSQAGSLSTPVANQSLIAPESGFLGRSHSGAQGNFGRCIPSLAKRLPDCCWPNPSVLSAWPAHNLARARHARFILWPRASPGSRSRRCGQYPEPRAWDAPETSGSFLPVHGQRAGG